MMRETGFVTHSEYQKHIRGEWRTVHDLWRHIRNYMASYAQPGGFTQGSIAYAGADGFLTENNAQLYWDAAQHRLGIGTNTPGCALDIEFPGEETVLSRVSAKTRPWRHWECIDGNWGYAFGIHADDKMFHIHYDTPIGSEVHGMIHLDGENVRVGILVDVPAYPLDVGGNTRIQGTFRVTGATVLVGGAQLLGGVTGDLSVTGLLAAAGGDFLVASGDALRVGTASNTSDIDFHLGHVAAGDNWGTYGFYWRYKGSGSGNDNTLQLWAQNQVAADVKVYEIWQDGKITFSPDVTLGTLGAGQTTLAKATLVDDARGFSSIFTLSADPAKSDGIALYSEGHIGNITTDGPTYGGGIWLNIDAGAILGADVRALDIGIYERGANCTGGNAYGLAIHMDFDITDPPAAIYPFRLNCEVSGATPDALMFAANKAALAVTEGTFPFNNYLKIVVQDGTVYRIPLITEGVDESICLSAELRFYDNENYVGFEAPALEANQIWVLPAADGNVGEALVTDGEGNLVWAPGGNGAVTFTGLVDTPADYEGAANKIVKVNATPSALVFGADIEELEDVDTITGQAGKYAKVKDGDAGIEWDVPAGGNGAIDYLDNFEDESLHWTWRTDNTDANKTITEAGNVLTIAIAGGTEGNWWTGVNTAPKVITGIRGFPCEVICKLNSYSVPEETNAGLHVSHNAMGTLANHAINYVRQATGLVVAKIGTVLDGNLITTLPIWLRIRILSFPTGAMGSRLIFSYSIDGSAWTDQFTYDLYDFDIRSCGLVVKNWGAKNAIAAPFDFFKVVPSLGADG